ncbi:hypothetical protein [Thalassomonas sp. RHCl1]|uniref:hypothetical protein n=1 Tax=Thalassomonas sp. RHCl1 TaxID=2995320 RepID=UPI00248BE222|nr:hypothetical protein [Thalassomonas sp. RHCl1]
MFKNKQTVKIAFVLAFTLACFSVLGLFNQAPSSLGYIVKGTNTDTITELTLDAGGEITHTLPIINAIGAKLTEQQKQVLLRYPQVIAIYADRSINSADKDVTDRARSGS